MSARTGNVAPGFHGKLPLLGDFVQRRLPPEFVEPWDRACQEAMAGLAARLGDDHKARCLAAPVWRFALAAHVCGPRPWTGAVTLSSDRVGRIFPLVLAVSAAPTANGWPRWPEAAWFDAAEAIVHEAREHGSLAEFDRAAHALADPRLMASPPWVPAGGGLMRSLWWRGGDPSSGVALRGLPNADDYLRFIDGLRAERNEEPV
ncbi:type VI secretion system protein ImpM [Luteibacter sp. W1I16]|uniref:type VI secretion system-associated protein TagF n=1 Tax=Luteibacter sp. W1I16 TaxID=3373922 RepID=UPI003D1C8F86